jgi:tetratricopeptide (TPR) repeat protein
MSQPSIACWAWRIWAEWFLGFPDRSRRSSERGLELARRFGTPYMRCFVTAWGASGAILRRDWSEGRRLGLEASKLGSEHGFAAIAAVGAMNEANAAVEGEGDAAGLDRFARAIQGSGATGNRGGATQILGGFTSVQLTLDRRDEALRTLEGALGLARSTGEAHFLAQLLRLKGEAVLGLEGRGEEEAEALFREAIEIARGQQAKSFELRAATSLARLCQRQGKRREAREQLAPIYAWFTEGFDTPDLIEAKALLAELG